jgi:hypothetical protein
LADRGTRVSRPDLVRGGDRRVHDSLSFECERHVVQASVVGTGVRGGAVENAPTRSGIERNALAVAPAKVGT